MYGIVGGAAGAGGMGASLNPIHSYNNYKEVLFKNYDVDFFTHSWSTDFEEDVRNLYQPKNILFEKQIDFSHHSIAEHSMDHINTYKKIFTAIDDLQAAYGNNESETSKPNVKAYLERYLFNAHSKWYSLCTSINLLENYVKEKRVHYDLVMLLRYDLFFRESIPFEQLDGEFFYTPPRFDIDIDVAINDCWFISNYENIIKYSDFYQNISHYSIWTHSSAKQHLEKHSLTHKEFPPRHLGRKNYWVMRDVLRDREHLKNLTLINNLKIKILGRLSWFNKTLISIFERFQNTLDSCLKKISLYY